MTQRDNLRRRVFAVALVPALTAIVLLVGIVLNRFSDELNAGVRNGVVAIARQAVSASEFALFTRSLPALQQIADSARLADKQVRKVLILDAAGKPLVSSGALLGGTVPDIAGVAQTEEKVVVNDEVISVLVAVRPSQIAGVAAADLWADEATTASAEPVGYVYVVLSLSEVQQQRLSMVLVVLGTTLVGLLLATWLSLRLIGAVLRPLQNLTKVVERIGNDDLSARVEPDSEGMLRSLEQGVNDMAARIEFAYVDLTRRVEEATEEIRREKDALGYMARTDPLTGLKNRRAFDDEVQLEIRRALRHGSPLTLVMIDIDNFKMINDHYGHQFGDLVLIHFSRLLSELIRDIDVPGRWGGEEFVVLMPDTALEAARQVAERIRQSFEAAPLQSAGQLCVATASFGVAQLDHQQPSLDALLAKADAALYRAKGGGRNQVVVA